MRAEAHIDRAGERLDRHGLRQAGHALQHDVAVGQQAHHQLLHHVLLAHDHFLHFVIDQVDEGAGLLDAVVQVADAFRRYRARA